MDVVNTTPYQLHPFDCSVGPTLPVVSLIVKGTFELAFGEPAKAVDAPKQRPMRGDETYLDDLGRSLAYASDLVAHKPRGEVLLKGSCRVPDGRPRKECDVSLIVGPIQKTLRVLGERRWKPGHPPTPETPQVFTTMPLRWEHAFGSLASRENPLGRGVEPVDGEVLLPNLELPDHLLSSPEDRPAPAGFGPIAPHWSPRVDRQGTRDARWVAFRAPLPPQDFDPRFHDAAPDDQQLPDGEYFRGDEPVALVHTHADVPRFECALPGKRLRLFLWLRSPDGAPNRWSEIALRLDTVFIDADASELTLVWRRPLQVSSPAYPEIEALYLAEEDLASEPAPAEVHFARFRALRPEEPSDQQVLQAQADTQMAEAHKVLVDAKIDPKLCDRVAANQDPEAALEVLKQAIEAKGRELQELTAKLQARLPPR